MINIFQYSQLSQYQRHSSHVHNNVEIFFLSRFHDNLLISILLRNIQAFHIIFWDYYRRGVYANFLQHLLLCKKALNLRAHYSKMQQAPNPKTTMTSLLGHF